MKKIRHSEEKVIAAVKQMKRGARAPLWSPIPRHWSNLGHPVQQANRSAGDYKIRGHCVPLLRRPARAFFTIASREDAKKRSPRPRSL
jgi:hypothetical protein